MNLFKDLQLKFSLMSIFVAFVINFVIAVVKRGPLFFWTHFPSLSYVKPSESFIPHHLSYALKVMLFFCFCTIEREKFRKMPCLTSELFETHGNPTLNIAFLHYSLEILTHLCQNHSAYKLMRAKSLDVSGKISVCLSC